MQDGRGGPGNPADAVRAALLEVATPQLYRANAFRITGLTVDATGGQIRRRAQEARAMAALGAGAPRRGPLPLPRPADAEAVQAALTRVRDPLARLVDELFWFWPSPGPGDAEESDPALAALAAGDVAGAERRWTGSLEPTAIHNLAVLHHALALDEEHAGVEPRTFAGRRWREAYRAWVACWRDDAVWGLLGERAGRLDHPGFGVGTAAVVREHLPLALASVNAVLAGQGAERGWPDDAVRVHWDLAGHQDLPPGVRAVVVREATGPLVTRVEIHQSRAAAALRERPGDARAIAEVLAERTAPLLRCLVLARAGDVDGVHDTVARTLLEAAGVFQQRTDDWAGTLAILRLAAAAARGAVTSGVVREQVAGVQRILARTAQDERGYGPSRRQPPEPKKRIRTPLPGGGWLEGPAPPEKATSEKDVQKLLEEYRRRQQGGGRG